MLLQLSSDQEFFQKTTARCLEDNAPVAELRRRREDPDGFKSRYWRQGAELGWTSLLVSEDNGGVSISGRGLVDLTLVAYEFGRHAAPGPLAATNVVAGALSAAGEGAHKALIAGLLDGSALVAWCISEDAPDDGLDTNNLRFEIAVQVVGLGHVFGPHQLGSHPIAKCHSARSRAAAAKQPSDGLTCLGPSREAHFLRSSGDE